MNEALVKLTMGDVQNVDRLIEKIALGVDVNFAENASECPLEVAIKGGYVDACRVLLAAGASLKNVADGSLSPLCVAIESRHPVVGDKVSGFSCRPLKGRSAAFSGGELSQILGLLVGAGAHPDGHVDDSVAGSVMNVSQSPLWHALANEDVEAVASLADLGADLNVELDMRGGAVVFCYPMPALKIAVAENWFEGAIALLRAGADDACLAGNGGELTPFQHAVACDQARLVEYYVRERGEDLAQRTSSGRTLLQIAGGEDVKLVLRSLKTECAVQIGVDGQLSEGGQKVSPSKNGLGML